MIHLKLNYERSDRMELEMALKEASAIRRVDICIIFDSTCLPISEKKIDLSSFQ